MSALAGTLNAFLPRDRPSQLRLFTSTAGTQSGSYKSVGDFAEALNYFERAGRCNILSEVYDRAIQTPVAGASESGAFERKPRKKRETRGRGLLIPAASVAALVAIVAAGVSFVEHHAPGALAEPSAALAKHRVGRVGHGHRGDR